MNFYSRHSSVPQDVLDIMVNTARAQGLGPWMDAGLKLHTANQANCDYPFLDGLRHL